MFLQPGLLCVALLPLTVWKPSWIALKVAFPFQKKVGLVSFTGPNSFESLCLRGGAAASDSTLGLLGAQGEGCPSLPALRVSRETGAGPVSPREPSIHTARVGFVVLKHPAGGPCTAVWALFLPDVPVQRGLCAVLAVLAPRHMGYSEDRHAEEDRT